MENFSDLSLSGRKLVVAIDFGTTYSGVAWAETRRPDQQLVIESWPSDWGTHEGYSSPKVPTELRYIPQGIEWGAQIPPFVDRHNWFKLQNKLTAAELSRSPDELTESYLKQLYEHLMYTLEQKVGSRILKTIPLDFVLTVPAIWSEKAKERTLAACNKAGIRSSSKILLVSEPEAAAVYALHGLDPHGLRVGDTFIICDAGGGTVDLISYTISELYPFLKVKEAAPGGGDRCGSTFLNRGFKEYLVSKLGREPGWDDELLSEALDRFETVIKKNYSLAASKGEDYTIMVPGLLNNERLGVRRGRLTVKAADMRGIFDPVINKIIELVKDQMRTTKKEIRAVLLVGGFGQNNYLKERLRNSLQSSVVVMQPPNAWTAVVRGAVMMGLARDNVSNERVSVASRAARKHYGVELHIPFDPLKHDDNKKFWSEKEGEYRAYTMHWFIKKGDPVKESEPHPLSFFTDFLVSNGQPTSTKIRVYCDEISPTPPTHKTGNVKELVMLKADLSQLPPSDYKGTEKLGSNGVRYYEIWGTIEATYYSAQTRYIVQVAGKRYDTVFAEHV